MADRCGWKMGPMCNTDLANFLRSGVFAEGSEDWRSMRSLPNVTVDSRTALYLYGSHKTLMAELNAAAGKKISGATNVGVCYERNIVRYDLAMGAVKATAAALSGTASLIARFANGGDERVKPVRDWGAAENTAGNIALSRTRDAVQLPTLIMVFDLNTSKAPKAKIRMINTAIDVGALVPLLQGQYKSSGDSEYTINL